MLLFFSFYFICDCACFRDYFLNKWYQSSGLNWIKERMSLKKGKAKKILETKENNRTNCVFFPLRPEAAGGETDQNTQVEGKTCGDR